MKGIYAVHKYGLKENKIILSEPAMKKLESDGYAIEFSDECFTVIESNFNDIIDLDLTLETLIKQCWLFGEKKSRPNFNELITIIKQYLQKMKYNTDTVKFYPDEELFNDLRKYYKYLENKIFPQIGKLCDVIISYYRTGFDFEKIEVFNYDGLILLLNPIIINDKLKFEPSFKFVKITGKKNHEDKKKLCETSKFKDSKDENDTDDE